MYSQSPPSTAVEQVDNHLLCLENGLRSSNAPAHAINSLYQDSAQSVSSNHKNFLFLTVFKAGQGVFTDRSGLP